MLRLPGVWAEGELGWVIGAGIAVPGSWRRRELDSRPEAFRLPCYGCWRMSRPESAERVCPFCRLPFPDADRCPDHDLELVVVTSEDEVARGDEDDSPSPSLSLWPAVGLVGSLLVIIGFCLPMASNVVEGARTTVTGVGFASTRGSVLWIIPAVSVFVAYVLSARFGRDVRPGFLRAAPFLIALSAVALGYAALGLHRGAAALSEQRGVPVSVELEPGLWMVFAGLGLAFAGSVAVWRHSQVS